jgi:hypothetical protein
MPSCVALEAGQAMPARNASVSPPLTFGHDLWQAKCRLMPPSTVCQSMMRQVPPAVESLARDSTANTPPAHSAPDSATSSDEVCTGTRPRTAVQGTSDSTVSSSSRSQLLDLPPAALDLVVAHVRGGAARRDLRLVCRALRSVVDAQVRWRSSPE